MNDTISPAPAVSTATDGGRSLVGPEDDPITPEYRCDDCHAQYYGHEAARECCQEGSA